jgi:hypothetical protein
MSNFEYYFFYLGISERKVEHRCCCENVVLLDTCSSSSCCLTSFMYCRNKNAFKICFQEIRDLNDIGRVHLEHLGDPGDPDSAKCQNLLDPGPGLGPG